jgi:hypothetical protein
LSVFNRFAPAINGDEQIAFPLRRLDLDDVYVGEADRAGLLPWLLVAINVRRPPDPVSLKRKKAVVERRVTAPDSDD